ncbi:D-alanyl-D-alanine carboxypeptidase/D-alanyl-D-alanine-endopeptidase [Bacillus sp. 31A1R]|uniref:D-alanyl-D-alanine carboxypeptidase/D-alanyl-D-alanine-endopeptidase n=1 Tax=Robertmurraya mangrovi TaxID=3098077 RepID=A0ABU5J382_9BACI|nr:D-alanyl-D-alanine carboxypeptidase/D-alanyl-D-alanine-endopeptidase [Bacillus sp. 31A1R]MDZ5473877.1 D-alanyl-D-alanine carboxypeptidase/D-alanyl-D-alanine-endopeptidase [Bacillus sp. 31A1R]
MLISTFIFNCFNANPVQAINKSNLNKQITDLVSSHPDLNGALIGISVRNATTGELVYNHFGNVRLRPASNLKLFTAAAALSALGEDYTFKTEILTDGVIKRKKLKGNLYLKGKGDPTLMISDLNRLAKELSELGIKTIRGNLIADDSWYDSVRYSIDLPWSDETTYYGAQISALNVSPDDDYDTGTVQLEIVPGKTVGEKATISLHPKTHYVTLINQTNTVDSSGKKDLSIKREHGSNKVIIQGSIPIESKSTKEWIAVWEPTKYVLTLFEQSLKKYGIKVQGKTIQGVAPEDTKVILRHESMPLSELLIPFMKLSNNSHGEVLVKEMGKVKKGEGSWEKGLEVLDEELKKLGMNPDTMVLRDGSGISHVNLVPANEVSFLLHQVQKKFWFPLYLNSLPVTGSKEKMSGGTLRYRMESASFKGRVHAKTGSLSTVSSLSGYLRTNSGEDLIFSIIINNLATDANGKLIEDQICTIILNQ